MRKVSLWWGLAASAAIIAAGGCKSTSSSSPTAANSNPVNGSGTRSEMVASANDPLSLNSKTPAPGPDFYVTTARYYEANLNFDSAKEQYDHALKIDPGYTPALLGYAHLYDRQREFAEADKYYQIAAKKHPEVAAVWNDWGMSEQRRGHFEKSAKLLAKATKLQPDKQLYRNNLAMVLVVMHQPQEAYHQLAAIETPAVAHFNLATILHRAGDDQNAAYHFAEASKADPSWAQARVWAERLNGAGPSTNAIAFSGDAHQPPPDPRPDAGPGAPEYVASREPVITSAAPSPESQPAAPGPASFGPAINGPTVVGPSSASYSNVEPGPVVTPTSGISYPAPTATPSGVADAPLPPPAGPSSGGTSASDDSAGGLTPFPPVR